MYATTYMIAALTKLRKNVSKLDNINSMNGLFLNRYLKPSSRLGVVSVGSHLSLTLMPPSTMNRGPRMPMMIAVTI